MIIATWNCNMAFRKKASHMMRIQPDILVVQECEHPDRLIFESPFSEPLHKLWFGDNKAKGLGIFAYSDFRLELHNSYDPSHRYIVPIKVSGAIDFNLFAVWAMDDKLNRRNRYVGQVWNAVNHYSHIGEKTVIVGDFNSNAIWDNERPLGSGNHSALVNHLSDRNIHSAYHHHFQEQHGKEHQPTFFLHRKIERPYHIDYCFLSEEFLNMLDAVTIGEHSDWIKYSDHMPVYIKLRC
jgi:exodeoxyribonuclease III